MIRPEDFDALLAETEGAPPSLLIERLIARLPDDPARDDLIAELVDESRAAWQWLLADRPRGRLLYLSGAWCAAVLSLARVWDRVTVLDPSPAALRLLERRAEAEGLDNIDPIAGGDAPLPFPDASFDAVCWTGAPGRRVPCSPDDAPWTIDPLLDEAVRVLAPDGQIHLALPNRWRRGKAPHQARPPLFSLDPTLRRLKTRGLKLHGLSAQEPDYEEARFLVDLNDTRSVRAFQARHPGRGRLLPVWFYRRSAPVHSITAGPGPALPGWLDAAFAALRVRLGAEGSRWHIDPPAVNRKGKLLAVLREGTRPRWMIKMPLLPETRDGMETAHAVLTRLEEALPADHPLAGRLPGGLMRFEHRGVPLFVESICEGRSWGGRRPLLQGVAETDFPDVIAALEALDPVALELPLPEPRPREKIILLSSLLASAAPELIDVLSAVADRLEAAGAGRPLRLRKGDLTLSNVFLDGSRVSGLIDWDDTETCRIPLTAYADLVFSWLWQREGLSRAKSLARIVGGDLAGLPAALGVADVLARTRRDETDLVDAALASWLDHAYQELRHPVFRYQASRVRGLLVGPLRGVVGRIPPAASS